MTEEEKEKLIRSLSNRINALNRDLRELKKANINYAEKFKNFAEIYFKPEHYYKAQSITVFTIRELRRRFNTYLKGSHTFPSKEIVELLNDYCDNNNLIVFPRYEGDSYYSYGSDICLKNQEKGDRACFVFKKDTELLSELIESLTKK